MIAVLILAAVVVITAVGAFVWTAVRSAVRQAVDNARRDDVTAAPVAWWSADPDAPVQMWPTYTDPRAVADPVDEPVYGQAADTLRDDLRRQCY